MCILLREDQIVPKIAEQDIEVYKVGYVYENPRFRSFPVGEVYIMNQVRLEPEFLKDITTAGIFSNIYRSGKGMYTIGNLQRAKHYLIVSGYKCIDISTACLLRIHKAIIPKGAKYVVDDYAFYISDSLIVTDEMVDYLSEIKPGIIESLPEHIRKYVPENNNKGS